MNPTPLLGIQRHKYSDSACVEIELTATMSHNLPDSPGIYTLIITVLRAVTGEVGKLGPQTIVPGLYTYTGSALGQSVNLKTRISRHLRSQKKTRWHIDYLLGWGDVAVKAVICAETTLRKECEVARNIEQMANIDVEVRGFGSSDCTRGCTSHLHCLPTTRFHEVVSQIVAIYAEVFHDTLPPVPISYLTIRSHDQL